MAKSTRRRIDVELVRRGLATDLSAAVLLVESHRVLAAGSPVTTPARLVADHENLHVLAAPPTFVSRGGHKLSNALDATGILVSGRRCLDLGASTGGFTDCLLQRGAVQVICVDVGRAQLHQRIAVDPRVVAHERTNAVDLTSEIVGDPIDIVVADISFQSVVTVAAPAVRLAMPDADLLVLVKPQFESTRGEIAGTGGVITDPGVWKGSLERVADALPTIGLTAISWALAEPAGAQGNSEFFVHAMRSGRESVGTDTPARSSSQESIQRAIAAAEERNRPTT